MILTATTATPISWPTMQSKLLTVIGTRSIAMAMLVLWGGGIINLAFNLVSTMKGMQISSKLGSPMLLGSARVDQPIMPRTT